MDIHGFVDLLTPSVRPLGALKRGVDEVAWGFTEKVFATCAAQASSSKDELWE